MKHIPITKCIALPFLAALITARADASFSVSNWSVGCGIQNHQGNGTGFRIHTVQSPYAHSDQAQFGISTISENLSTTFDLQSLDFTSDVYVTAEGTNQPVFRSFCDGSFRITTDRDLLLDADLSFMWNLPDGDRESLFQIGVVTANPHIAYFSDSGGAQPVFGDPRVFTATTHGSAILLPANHTFGFSYNVEIDSFGGSPAILGTGQGHAHFSVRTVPEPSLLPLLSIGAIALRHRRTRPVA